MLHTRYAPVRHSCTPERALPFDLHVLGLPLAFILSQDQTLHCNNYLLFSFSIFTLRHSARTPWSRAGRSSRRFRLPVLNVDLFLSRLVKEPFFILVSGLLTLSSTFLSVRDCKGTSVFQTCNLFFQITGRFFFASAVLLNADANVGGLNR
jgi:hypothetical protein